MNSLVAPEELREILASVTVLDVRWQLGRTDGREQYLAGHVPGASYVDLETDLADPPGLGGRHPLPETERFETAMRRSGVRRDRPVVVYDATGGLAAARAWWLLGFHGHDEVALLDGGWPAWTAAGHEVEAGEPAASPGDFVAQPGQLRVVGAKQAARVARDGVLLDARAPERYRGEVEPVDPVAGHIPGAVNLPTSSNLADGRWKSVEELAEVYAVTEGAREVAAYCGSGVTAAHDVFAMHLLGRDAALYPGSWSGWITDPERPVETGDAGGLRPEGP